MNAKDYREQVARELQAATRRRSGARVFRDAQSPARVRQRSLEREPPLEDPEDIEAARALAEDAGADAGLRATALKRLAQSGGEHETLLALALRLLSDGGTPHDVRAAAVEVVQQASFFMPVFDASRPEYLTALRAQIDDPDPELRQRVLGILAREKDGATQQRLLEGLSHPARALVPPEKALQLLGYDMRAEFYPVARELAAQRENPEARAAALRLLAADADSRPLFQELLLDPSESDDVRRLSLAALQALDPQGLRRQARALLLDEGESGPLQAACLAALTHLGDAQALQDDEPLRARVSRMQQDSKSAPVQRGARAFMRKAAR